MKRNNFKKRSIPKALPSMRRGGLWGRLLCILLLCTLSFYVPGCDGAPIINSNAADTVPPVITGVHDIEILQGDGIAYRDGVRAVDDCDGEITFEVEAGNVNRDLPGSYTVIYRAVDAAGNVTVAEANVVVRARSVTYEQLWAEVDSRIAKCGFRGLSLGEFCEEFYYYIKGILSYASDSNKSDWVAEAYRGMTEGTGDCFTYYAVARAFFERLGVSVLTVQRAPDVLSTTHYWLLVNTGTETYPAWYHWDACPHPMEYPLISILLTDAELLAYNQQMADYYTFDASLYPATPTESFGD